MILPRSVEGGKDRIGHTIDGQAFAATKVNRFAVSSTIIQCTYPSIHNVIDVDEIARLLTVAEDRDRLVAQEVPKEDS